MESSTTPPSQADNEPRSVSLPKDRRSIVWIVILVLLVGAALAFGIYYKVHDDTTSLTGQNNTLSAQLSTLSSKIKEQQDVNNGIVSSGAIYKDPAGKIGLLNGAITMTLPNGWERVPAGGCTGGTIDSIIVCQDIAAVAPKNLVRPNGTVSWSVPIKVFDYTSSDGSAENWLYSDYEGGYSTGAINVSSSPINGYSAYSYEYQAFDIYGSLPEYTQAYYAIVHGRYGLVIDTAVQSGSSSSTPGSYDYRNTYQPQIEQMLKTIKFQD